MKCSKATIHRKTHRIPEIKFEDQRLTSFAGLVVYQSLFARIGMKQQLTGCFRHLTVSPIFGHGVIVLLLTIHLLLGYRRLQDMRYYQDDPMVRRLLGLEHLPDVATVSRTLAGLDDTSVTHLRRLSRQRVLEQLSRLGLARITLDFDGSVLSTGRFAEGTAVGFNRKKKGQRSYYPLFCTIAQTGQVLDVWHRPGNVHDSNGAKAFILACVREIKAILPRGIVEARMDSAFFSDDIVRMLDAEGVQFTISVPFERFTALKALIENRQRWRHLNGEWSFFEANWKPASWNDRYRFIFARSQNRQQYKGPVQLDLFIPYEYGYGFKVIITNKPLSAKKALTFHNGRGAQEGVFAELKSQTQMDYVPTRKKAGNQVYLLSAVLAHNLNREMQMLCYEQERNTTEKRTPLWRFEQLGTLRRKLIQRAGRLTRPQGHLTLTMSANTAVKSELLHYLDVLGEAA
ncbi:MAG: IS1380 family transposase [Pseudomonadota bacterium]